MRISGVELKNKKRVLIALRQIYGIGPTKALYICEKAGIELQLRVKDLTTEQGEVIQKIIEEEMSVEGQLKRKLSDLFRAKIQMKLLRAVRRMKGLPCNGQRTKSNGKTAARLGGIK